MLVLLLLNFNPRSHEGSDVKALGYKEILQISIHAPTRGATNDSKNEWYKTPISIHAPTRGATFRYICLGRLNNDFNPRSHEGSDSCRKHKYTNRIYFNPRSHEGSDLFFVSAVLRGAISIHAPTRGATPRFHQHFRCHVFQSTLPRGERLLSPSFHNAGGYFNPRSHEGSDFLPRHRII